MGWVNGCGLVGVLGWDVSLVCGCLLSKCEKWGYYVGFVWYGDLVWDWY